MADTVTAPTFGAQIRAGLTWTALSTKEMYGTRWYLRRERMIFYSIASLLGIAAQAAAEFSMSKYEATGKRMARHSEHAAQLHAHDIRTAAILTMVLPCILVVTYDAEYLRLLFWPFIRQARWYVLGKKILVAVSMVGTMATAVYSTIVVVNHSAFITGVDAATQLQLTQLFRRPPLEYKTWPTNLAWIILLWISMIPNIVSFVLLFMSPEQERLTAANESLEGITREMSAGSGSAASKEKLPAMSVATVAV